MTIVLGPRVDTPQTREPSVSGRIPCRKYERVNVALTSCYIVLGASTLGLYKEDGMMILYQLTVGYRQLNKFQVEMKTRCWYEKSPVGY